MKPRNSRMARFARFAGALIFLAFSACALTQEHINVGYVPQADVTKVSLAQGTITQVVVNDQRSSKDHVGHKSNGYGMEMAEIIADNDIPQTVKGAVESELTDRGFALGPNGAVIVVQLSKFENRFKTGFWSGTAVGEVTMSVTVKRPDGSIVYTKLIEGEGVNSGVQLASGENARIALEAGLKDAVTKLFSDSDFLNSLSVAAAKGPAKA